MDELKSRVLTLRKSINERNGEVTKLKNLKSTLDSNLAQHQDQLQKIKTEKDAACSEAQKKLNNVCAATKASMQPFISEVSERKLKIEKLRSDIFAVNLEIQHVASTLDISINNITLEQEHEDKRMELKVERELLENMYRSHKDLNKELDLVQQQLEKVSKYESDLKCKLFEALELKEVEELGNIKILTDAKTASKGRSVFDEVYNPRQELMEKLLFEKKYCENLVAQVDGNRLPLMRLCSLKFDLQEVIEIQLSEYQQDLEKSCFNYNVYIKTLKRLCKRLEQLVLEKEVLLRKWLKGDIGYFYEKLCAQHKKYEDDAMEHAYCEFRVMKLKSMDVREKILEIAHQKKEIAKQIKENNEELVEVVKENTSEIKELVVSDCFKADDKSSVRLRKKDKKVEFKENIEPKVTTGHVRKGGKILQYKTVHVDELKKKKNVNSIL